jgi:hypothetical protein
LQNAGALTLETTEIAALNDDDAVEKATQWAAQWLNAQAVDLATLHVTRDGVGIKTLPMEVHR